MVPRSVATRLAALALGVLAAGLLGEALVRLQALLVTGTASDRGGIDAPLEQHDPRLGWRGVPGAVVHHHTTEFDVEYALDEAGFRQGAPVADPRPEGPDRPPRLTLLGDSFTFGWGVDVAQRFGEQLARRLGAEVVNLGVPGTGTGQHLLLYTGSPGPHHRADVVVLGYLPEAVERVAADRYAGRCKPRFVLRDGELALTGVPVPESYLGLDQRAPPADPGLPLPGKRWLQRNSRLYALLRARLRAPLRRLLGARPADRHPAYATDAPAWQVTRALLARLAAAVAADGARLLVAIVPERDHLRPEAGDLHQRLILQACREAGIEALDLTPALAGCGLPADDLYYPVDGHWTPAAHAVAARALAETLLARGLVTPPR